MKALFHGHEKDAGIYLIRNRVNGSVYVGETVFFKKRFANHRIELSRGIHPNRRLQADYAADPNALSFEVTAIVSDDAKRLAVEEDVVRGLYGPDCYNMSIGSRRGGKMSEETKARMRSSWTPERRAEAALRASGNTHRRGAKAPQKHLSEMHRALWTSEKRAEASKRAKDIWDRRRANR